MFHDQMKLNTPVLYFTLSGDDVSWKSSKKMCIAHSTMESELIVFENACVEAKWLKTS